MELLKQTCFSKEQPVTLEQWQHLSREHQDRILLGWIPILSPVSKLSMLWSIFMLLFDGSYTACLMPIVVAFFGSPCSTSWLHIMDWTAGAIYWTDIAAHFVIGFVIVSGGEKMPILDAGCVAWQYIRHGTCLWDVASAAPILVEVVLLTSRECRQTTTIHVIVLLKLLRFIHIRRVFKGLTECMSIQAEPGNGLLLFTSPP
ncbi:hypothetical protein WJX84_010938 [Apatococcus fuscideae]|uniref:Ion transport domain-containing protein n=1 Tax=Apatococcus fuscideae TaxID=2026836 RepID=A0AAW1SS70_9CHLO